MSYNFYDFNNALKQRDEYVEDRLRDGSPVIAVSYDAGVLLLSARTTQRKVYEVYDRLMMGALGKQSDIESIRLAAIDSVHREGFSRSEDDVSLSRLIGFGLSPAMKKVYNDNNVVPLTFRGLFVEVNKTVDDDQFYVLGFDGEYRATQRLGVAAGTAFAEAQAAEALTKAAPTTLDEALKAAIEAWSVARVQLEPLPEKLDDDGSDDDEPVENQPKTPEQGLKEALASGLTIEAGILERSSKKQIRFRLLKPSEIPLP